jgi:hypothetical protein
MGKEIEPRRLQLPALREVLRAPLAEVLPALAVAREISKTSSCGPDDWRERLQIFPRVRDARLTLRAALWPLYRNVDEDRQISGAIIASMFRALGMKASDDVEGQIEGVLAAVIDGDEIAQAMGQRPLEATVPVLAMAAQLLLRSVKFPPRPSEVVEACRAARRTLTGQTGLLRAWIESLRTVDWRVLETDVERWRAAHQNAEERMEMLCEHAEHFDPDHTGANERAIDLIDREWPDDDGEGDADA